MRAERRAAPKPARRAMCSQLNAASIAVPMGAEAGHRASSGRPVPAEGLRHRHSAVCTTGRTETTGMPAVVGGGLCTPVVVPGVADRCVTQWVRTPVSADGPSTMS